MCCGLHSNQISSQPCTIIIITLIKVISFGIIVSIPLVQFQRLLQFMPRKTGTVLVMLHLTNHNDDVLLSYETTGSRTKAYKKSYSKNKINFCFHK